MSKFFSEFKGDFRSYLKVAALVLALIALFVVCASGASPALAYWDTIRGYGI
jgi:hypothetical protein